MEKPVSEGFPSCHERFTVLFTGKAVFAMDLPAHTMNRWEIQDVSVVGYFDMAPDGTGGDISSCSDLY